jgi:ribulose-phosphate 3-epimerase
MPFNSSFQADANII